MFIRILNIFLFWTVVLAGTKVFAADTQAVDVRLQAFQVVADKGAEKLVPATESEVGDTIEYQITYQNNGKNAARGVAATLPVPDGAMKYLPGSAAPKAVQASVDGKKFMTLPLTREVMKDGVRVTERVPAADYRYLRWDLGDLAPGQAVTVTSRMRVVSAGMGAAAPAAPAPKLARK